MTRACDGIAPNNLIRAFLHSAVTYTFRRWTQIMLWLPFVRSDVVSFIPLDTRFQGLTYRIFPVLLIFHADLLYRSASERNSNSEVRSHLIGEACLYHESCFAEKTAQ